MVHDARDHEQRGFEGGVVEHVEYGRHSGQRRAQAHQKGDQAQVTDSGIGQQTLEIVLEDGDEGRKQYGDEAHRGDNRFKITRPGQHRVHAHEQEHPGLDHRGRVQVSRNRCGRGHGIGQPKMEGELRTFGKGPQQNQQQCGQKHGVGLNVGHVVEHGTELISARNLAKQHKAPQHGQTATAGHRQRLTGTGSGIGPVTPITHQQERRHTGQLPEHHQQQQVVRQHHTQHGGHEEHHLAVELARRILGTQVIVRIQDDHQPDEQDQARKHQRQAIKAKRQVQPELGHPRPGIEYGLARQHGRGHRQQQAQTGGRDRACRTSGQKSRAGTQPERGQGSQQ